MSEKRLCVWCQTYPVRGFQPTARYCSDECCRKAYQSRRTKKYHPGFQDFSPAQIEARYARARWAKGYRRFAA